MAELKDAFAGIAPIDWTDVSKDDLGSFLKTTFAHAETLANSVPLPPSTGSHDPTISHTKHASSAAETVVSPQPTDLDTKYAELQKPWGKPIKISPKDNPLNVSVYKTAGHDRRGAWFARRSVHAGLSYSRWKDAMRQEFPTSLKVNKGPGSGAVRGIAGDARLERETVDGVGNAEVWLLSSSFPGPVAPRDFCGLISNSDTALTEASDLNGKHPRHYIVVSRPTTHPGAEERPGLVRGQYESVELMREIPGSGEDQESNLIEWVMITRSDPGGGIPRFMVERGTPGSIVADVPKFIDWAIHRDETVDNAVGDEEQTEPATEQFPDLAASEPNLHQPTSAANQQDQLSKSAVELRSSSSQHQSPTLHDNSAGNSSLLGNLTTAIGSTMGSYLPYFGGEDLKHHSTAATARSTDGAPDDNNDDEDGSSSSSSSNSDGTFASADDGVEDDDNSAKQSTDAPASNIESVKDIDLNQAPETHHDKEMHKLKKKRIELDHRMAKAREEESQKLREAEGKEVSEGKKAREKAEKERRKQEEKYQKEIRQLEERRKKQERKTEESRAKDEKREQDRQRKAREKDAVQKAQRERDEVKASLKIAEKERDALEQQVLDLQRENNLLVQRMGAGESGMEAVNRIKQEALGRARARSTGSASSMSRTKASSSVSQRTPRGSMDKLVDGKACRT